MKQKEKTYLEAKDAYYFGKPIMSDDEFDVLESELKEECSDVIDMVGFKVRGEKFKHMSPMKSLDKIQFQHDHVPYDEWVKWLDQCDNPNTELSLSPKFDGSAVNMMYPGELTTTFVPGVQTMRYVTRGDGTEGQDVTSKLSKTSLDEKIFDVFVRFKNELPYNFEIRGEVVIKKKVFEDKYKNNIERFGREYKNPRNFVAGMLNREGIENDIADDLEVQLIEVKTGDTDYISSHHSFNHTTKTYTVGEAMNRDTFLEIYDWFLEHRKNSEYLIDGFVAAFDKSMRTPEMEKDHHPKWALAIKFPPKIAKTKIIDIEWNLGSTGILVPVAIVEPVDLDGSTVKRVTLHNFELAMNKGTGIGAEIELVKSGDIIPKVLKVLKESHVLNSPETYGGHEVYIDGVHLTVRDHVEMDEFQEKLLHRGIVALDIENIGPALSKRLYEAGHKNIFELFNVNKENLIESGVFKEGRELELLLQNIDDLKEVDYWMVINALQIKGCGRTMSKEIAKEMAGVDHDFSGLERVVVNKFSIYSSSCERKYVEKLTDILENKGIKVIKPKDKNMDKVSGTFECTGSPRDHGFKVKADFMKLALDHGFEHDKLTKDSSFLLTDSMGSSSSKMKKAEKLGVEIITYSDFVTKHLSS